MKNITAWMFPLMLIVRCALMTPFAFGAKRQPVQYDNTRAFTIPCERVWPVVVPVVSEHGFMPDSSDRAGGFMRLRFTRGASGWLASDKDVNTLTLHHVTRFLEFYDRFQISGAAISLMPSSNSCTASMQVEYQGFRGNSLAGKGWVALPSNGLMESRILADIAARTDSTPAAPPATPTAESEPAKAPQPKMQEMPALRSSQEVMRQLSTATEAPRGITVRFTSTPTSAEVDIDGEYWGTTPTADITRLPAGPHEIIVKKLGYQPWERKITVAPGDDRTIAAELRQTNDASKPRISGMN